MTQRDKAKASIKLADRRAALSEQVRQADPETLDRIEQLMKEREQ